MPGHPRRARRAPHGHGIPVEGQALAHLLARAAMRGRVALHAGPRVRPARAARAADRDASLDELARRYYACHAGADARRPRLLVRPADARLPPAQRRRPIEDGPVPRVLLPAFDELLLGWRDRTPTVPAEHARAVHPGGGILRAVILEDGVAVGTWSAPRRAGDVPFTAEGALLLPRRA